MSLEQGSGHDSKQHLLKARRHDCRFGAACLEKKHKPLNHWKCLAVFHYVNSKKLVESDGHTEKVPSTKKELESDRRHREAAVPKMVEVVVF